MKKPKLISIVGLTASGKTGIGIEMAKMFNGEIISADSRQVYKGLDIGTAKVTPEEAQGIPHHMIDIIEPNGHFDVFMFQQQAYKIIDDIIARGKPPIVVGGTGLYSRSVVEGYNYGKGKSESKYDVLQIALMPPKEWLVERFEKRNQERIDAGMIDETRKLLADGADPKWLRSLGLEYYWNMELIDGKITMEEYKYWLLIRTTQFAKRQRTWFKREKNTTFLENPETFLDDCIATATKFMI